MKINIFKILFIIVFNLIINANNVKSQEQWLYSICVQQNFSSWGNCSSDPDYGFADIYLNFTNSAERILIQSDRLNQVIEFNGFFYNDRQDKDLSYLTNSAGLPISNISVHTYATDIINDRHLYYDIAPGDLIIGKLPQPHEASDPCNNFISSNREGYTMTTNVIVDDPIFMTYNGSGDYSLDYEVPTIVIDEYYENGRSEQPELQVSPDNTNDWETIENVIIKPEGTIFLPYERVAGKKDVTSSHFYEWMGQPLKFRIVKTLINGERTVGNIVSPITFYPTGMQFTILDVQRSYCHNDVSVFVKLDNDDDQGYLDLDTDLMYWSLTDDFLIFNCEMVETGTPLVYEIRAFDGNTPADPFNEENSTPIIWTLQFISGFNSFATERTFTIPPRMPGISISQIDPIYNINGVDYDVPNMNDPYVILNMNDSSDFSYLRRPYKIVEGTDTIATIDGIPDTYNNMTQFQRDSMDAIFEEEYIELMKNPNNSYKSYYNVNLRNWCEQYSETGDPLLLGSGRYPKIVPGDELNYLYYDDYLYANSIGSYNIYLGKVGSSTSQRLTTGRPAYFFDGSVVVNGNYYFYIHAIRDADNRNQYCIYKAPISGGNGVRISAYYYGIFSLTISPDNNYLYYYVYGSPASDIYRIPTSSNTVTTPVRVLRNFGGNLVFSHSGDFLLYQDEEISTCKYVFSSNSSTRLIAASQNISMAITPDDQKVVYVNPYGGYWRILQSDITNSLEPGIQITNDVVARYARARISTLNDGTYLFSDSERYSVDLGQGNGSKPVYEAYRIRKAPIGNSINNGRILHPEFRSRYPLAIDENEGLCVFYVESHPTNPHSLFLFVLDVYSAAESLGDIFYPSNGPAQTWYDDYKAIYKEKWLAERLGIKISNQIHANQTQTLFLVDGDGCEYPPFDIYVNAPANASFIPSILSYPSDACSKNGRVRIRYNGGGVPPYVHSAGTLGPGISTIIVDSLGYGENTVYFNDGSGNESISLTVTIGSATRGITSTPPLAQTCSTANGRITINVGSVPGTKTYKVINQDTNEEWEGSTTANTRAFSTLPAGKYTAEVTSGTCFFSKEGIVVDDEIFGINNISPIDATTIGGTGSVSMSFVNRTNIVEWGSGAPSIFRVSENTNSINYSGVEPYVYNSTARHTDNSSRICTVPVQFTVGQPSFEGRINIDETNDDVSVSVSLLNGNSLIMPYRFRLLNSSRTLIDQGNNNSSFSSSTTNNGSYILNMVYGSNNIDIYTFNYPSATITNGYSATGPICPGGDGSITFTPTGGIDDNNLTISIDGLTYAALPNLSVKGGDFSYYVKDENTSYIDVSGNAITVNRSLVNFFNVVIPEPDPVSASTVIPIDVTCAGANNGTVSVEGLSGGSGNYRYRVDNGTWTDTQTTITGITPGSHILYLQDSQNNCPVVILRNFNIAEPDSVKIDSLRVIHPTCELENGEIYVEVSGGNGYYQFDWEYNGNPFYNSGTLEEDSITHLGDSLRFGFYRLSVIDNKSCISSFNIDLNEYINPQIDSIDITDVRCYEETNGAVQVIDVSGTNAADWISIRSLDFNYHDTIYNLADSFNNLLDGRYDIRVIDDIGCVSDLFYPLVVDQPDTVLYAVIDTILPVLAMGSATGRIHSTVYGGNDGLKDITLFDSDAVIIDQQFERSQFPVYFDSLYAGDYNIQVVDTKGCSYTSPIQTVEEPQFVLGFTVTEKNDALCKSQTGSFTVEGFGGWGEYSFKRASDNGFYNINSFENLYAGNYIVSVRDRYGAVYTDTVMVYEPKDSLQAELIDYINPTCGNNGNISLNIEGGTTPYKLVFENTTDTTIVATPQIYTYADRSAGGYLLHLTDSNECKFELETSLSDSELIDITDFNMTYPVTSNSTDGTIEAIVSGGRAPLSFVWRELFGSVLTETSSILANVASGHYEVTVGESDGCSYSERVYLPAITDLALEIIELQHETSYLAQNGFAQLRANIQSPATIEIIDPDGTSTIYNVNDSTGQFYEDNNNLYLRNLSGGNYFVSASNNLNEIAYAEFEIVPYEQFYIQDIQITHVKEINEASGSISVVAAGGAGNNTFDWNYLDGVGSLSSTDNEYTSILHDAIAGNYRFTALDRYGNSISQTVTIEQPASPLDIAIAEYRNESCKDYEDAYVLLQATGGWGDYQFKQDVVEYYSNSNTWLNLDVRGHYFYLIDKMGAIDSVFISITEPDYLTSSVELIDSVNCKNGIDGNISFDINGGTMPYSYALLGTPNFWTEDTVARDFAEDTYTFLFTDDNNCIGQDTLSVYMPEPDSLLFNEIEVTHTTCDTDNGEISVIMQGGTLPCRYEWTDFNTNIISTESVASGLNQSGYYFLDVYDYHNCHQHYEQLINPSTNPVVADVDTTPVLCFGDYTGTASIIEVIAASPYAPYQFTWSNADTGTYADGYEAGIHSVTISDTNNCSTVKYFEVTQPDSLQLVVLGSKDAHCFGYNDGFLEIEAFGGVGDYQFIWSTGDTIGRIDSLYLGDYTLTITDLNLCSLERTYQIYEPAKVIVDLGEDLKICPGNTINLDGENFTTHQWSSSQGVFSIERFVSIDSEDDYFLEVIDSIGCFAWDTISISIGNDALEAEFLMSSQAYLEDTVFVYEISNIELDSIYWDYNEDVFINITEADVPEYVLHLESLDTGIYNVGLLAYSGGCISIAVKQIEIIPGSDSLDGFDIIGHHDPLIRSLAVSPNPTDGNFIVEIELREEADIHLTVFSVDYGQVIEQREEYGDDYYEVGYHLSEFNTGLYVIMVTADNERKQIKLIIE